MESADRREAILEGTTDHSASHRRSISKVERRVPPVSGSSVRHQSATFHPKCRLARSHSGGNDRSLRTTFMGSTRSASEHAQDNLPLLKVERRVPARFRQCGSTSVCHLSPKCRQARSHSGGNDRSLRTTFMGSTRSESEHAQDNLPLLKVERRVPPVFGSTVRWLSITYLPCD